VNFIFDEKLSPACRDTALQLRALAWGQDETPQLSMLQICQELKKGQATVYGHMRLLRDRGALRWRPAGTTEIIVSFPAEYWNYENLEKPVNGELDTVSSKADELETSNSKDKSTALQFPVKPDLPKNVAKSDSNELFVLAKALADVCHMNFEANRGRLFSEAKQLHKAQPIPTPDLLRLHYNGRPECFWRRDDWRGKKGQNPTPWAIRQTWGQWAAAAPADPAANLKKMLEAERAKS
jgi:hypothetical protein